MHLRHPSAALSTAYCMLGEGFVLSSVLVNGDRATSIETYNSMYQYREK